MSPPEALTDAPPTSRDPRGGSLMTFYDHPVDGHRIVKVGSRGVMSCSNGVMRRGQLDPLTRRQRLATLRAVTLRWGCRPRTAHGWRPGQSIAAGVDAKMTSRSPVSRIACGATQETGPKITR